MADGARCAARVAGGLEVLPLPALEAVVRRAAEDDEERVLLLRGLPRVSKGMLAALQQLQLPLGRLKLRSVEAAVRQASAPHRAWNLHTLDLRNCEGVTDVSALAGCAALHTLNLGGCFGVTDVSALAGCAALHTLNLRGWE